MATKKKVQEEFLEEIIERIKLKFEENNFTLLNLTESPITGRSGKNTEYLALIQKTK
jgi:predicted rRNA methylase YqxC with S4 and FtsJ domains